MDQVWGDRFVSDTAIKSRIKQARRAIGTTARLSGSSGRFTGGDTRFMLVPRHTTRTSPAWPALRDWNHRSGMHSAMG
jgi:hypothetical protein